MVTILLLSSEAFCGERREEVVEYGDEDEDWEWRECDGVKPDLLKKFLFQFNVLKCLKFNERDIFS